MKYTKDLTDIIDAVITGMTYPIQVDTVVSNPDGTQTITCCDIYHAQKGFSVTINSITYKIVGFDQDEESLTLSGVGAIAEGTIFYLYSPFFSHGTPSAVNDEQKKEQNSFNKTPLCWLWENFTERSMPHDSPFERESSVELFFLTQADYENNLTADYYRECIKPMARFKDNFIKALEDSPLFFTDDMEIESENYSKFGVFVRDKGASKNILADKLSGIGTKMTLIIYNTNDDLCPCPAIVIPTGIGSAPIGTTPIL